MMRAHANGSQAGGEGTTRKRRLQKHLLQLRQANAEIDRLANLKDDFLKAITHRLRTPMTVLIEGI